MTPEAEALLDISREELESEFNETAERYLHMSGDEFIELVLKRQPLPKHPMTGHLLLMLGAGTGEELVGS